MALLEGKGELKILMLAVVVSCAVISDDNDKDVSDGNFNFVCSFSQMGAS